MRPVVRVFILLILLSCFSCVPHRESKLIIDEIHLSSVDDIYPIRDTLVMPVNYLNAISLEDYSVKERKEKFVEMILPAIMIERFRLVQLEKKVDRLLHKRKRSKHEEKYLDSLMTFYKADSLAGLVYRIHPHPGSLALAQAALETAWGTSRFFTEGNNAFGIWSFSKNDERMPAFGLRNDRAVYLKKFSSLLDAVKGYYAVIARGPYSTFRLVRSTTDNSIHLIKALSNYSENDDHYRRELEKIIRFNNLEKYDSFQLDRDFIK